MINQSIENTKCWISLICLFLNKTYELSLFLTNIAEAILFRTINNTVWHVYETQQIQTTMESYLNFPSFYISNYTPPPPWPIQTTMECKSYFNFPSFFFQLHPPPRPRAIHSNDVCLLFYSCRDYIILQHNMFYLTRKI